MAEKKSISVSEFDDIIYTNNVGRQYLLAEAVMPLGCNKHGTYDIIVAFPQRYDEEDGLVVFDCDAPVKWFCDGMSVRDFFSGKNRDLLDSCASFLDEH